MVSVLALSLAIITGMSACSDDDGSGGKPTAAKTANGSLTVYVVNYPLQYFAERIGGERVRVTLPVPAKVDPAFWAPEAEDIGAYQQADLILLNGASYAKWVQRVSLPVSRLVDTSAAFSDRYIPVAGQATHTHGAGGEHTHGDVAFTTWLDPLQAVEQAAAIRDALIRSRPDAEMDFRQGFSSLRADLDDLDGQLAAAFAARSAQPLLFSHPVYQYLIRRYRIDGRELHWEPDNMPNPEQWRAFDKLLGGYGARSMIWEGTPKPEIVAELKKRGVESLVFAPGGNKPERGDYLSIMQSNLSRLSRER